MAVTMLFILLRATRPAYADLPNERNTLNPGSETLCGRAPPLWGKPFLVAFWSFLSRGPAFVLNPSGLRGLDSARGRGFGVSGGIRVCAAILAIHTVSSPRVLPCAILLSLGAPQPPGSKRESGTGSLNVWPRGYLLRL